MAVRVREINAAAAVVAVYLTRLSAGGIGPKLDAEVANASKGSVKFFLSDKKREMLESDVIGRLKVVDRNIIRQINDQKMHKTPWLG